MPVVLTAFWNRHKKFKKNQKIWKPSHCVIIFDLVYRKNNKLGLRQMSLKSVLTNELSCVKIHGFQGKWSMLWQHSWHSLFKWYHISHKLASWNYKQCCQREFSFSLDKNFIFHFSSAQNEVFLWRTYHIFVARLDQINFLKY